MACKGKSSKVKKRSFVKFLLKQNFHEKNTNALTEHFSVFHQYPKPITNADRCNPKAIKAASAAAGEAIVRYRYTYTPKPKLSRSIALKRQLRNSNRKCQVSNRKIRQATEFLLARQKDKRKRDVILTSGRGGDHGFW
uniref:Uncharacterized protein n=1 Tax=Schizaphis graminum TaxID=13262 RepID=A0A2S2NM62_SCHGA